MIKLWNENLETGIPAIDDQHKELFRQVGVLFDNTEADRVPQMLEFLEKYVEKHFSDEQQLHLKSQYPAREPHKKMHIDFITAFKKMKQDYNADGAKLTVLFKINKTVADWLRQHIMVHDKEFAKYCKTSGIS
jgi:hemerythrin